MKWMHNVLFWVVAIIIAGASLSLMVGLFWIVDILPLAIFAAIFIAYAVLAARPKPDRKLRSNPGSSAVLKEEDKEQLVHH